MVHSPKLVNCEHFLCITLRVRMDEDAEVFHNMKNKSQTAVFKKPVLIGKKNVLVGKRHGNNGSGKISYKHDETSLPPAVIQQTDAVIKEDNKLNDSSSDSEKSDVGSESHMKSTGVATAKNLCLAYEAPSSACICRLPYKLEVIKDGMIIQSENLHDSAKSYSVFGRLPSCDIVLQHPSISR